MKRIISLICLVAMMLTMLVFLTSCAKVTCCVCNEEKNKMATEESEVFNKKIYTCKECIREAEELKEDVKDLFD